MKKTFDIFKNQCNLRLKYLLKKSEKLGFNDTDPHNDSFKLLRLISEDFDNEYQKKFDYAQVNWNMLNIFPNLNNEEELFKYYEDMICYTTNKRLHIRENLFVNYLKRRMKQKKIIYLFSDLVGYGVDDEEDCDEYEDEEDSYHLHGCSIILLPVGKDYRLLYINPHGFDMKETKHFEIKLSSTRKKVLNIKNHWM